MSDELPFIPAARRAVVDPSHLEAIRRAYETPVEKHPADSDMALVGAVIGRRRGCVQTRVGADGTRVDVAWGDRGPTRIIHVSPPGGDLEQPDGRPVGRRAL